MSRGKRYNKRKLNMKKVFAVIIAIIVIAMFFIGMKELLKGSPKTNEKTFALAYYTLYENEKWGVIDTRGNIVIKPEYEEMIVIPDNTCVGLIYFWLEYKASIYLYGKCRLYKRYI